MIALEGGYNLQALSYGTEAVTKVLLNDKLPYLDLDIKENDW